MGSTEESISVLNNLLHYENIDDGTFTLEPSLVPVIRFFSTLNFHALKLLASNCGLKLILDDTMNMMVDNGENKDNVRSSYLYGYHLYMDSSRIMQILRNLVTNATKFSSKGKSIAIRTYIEETNDLIWTRGLD